MPLLEFLMGGSPKAVAKKAAQLPPALTNGCEAVEACPVADMSASGGADSADFDNGSAPLDLPLSCLQIDSSSGSMLEDTSPGSMQTNGPGHNLVRTCALCPMLRNLMEQAGTSWPNI